MSYFIYTDSINSLLDPRLVDLGSTLIHVGITLNCTYFIVYFSQL